MRFSATFAYIPRPTAEETSPPRGAGNAQSLHPARNRGLSFSYYGAGFHLLREDCIQRLIPSHSLALSLQRRDTASSAFST